MDKLWLVLFLCFIVMELISAGYYLGSHHKREMICSLLSVLAFTIFVVKVWLRLHWGIK